MNDKLVAAQVLDWAAKLYSQESTRQQAQAQLPQSGQSLWGFLLDTALIVGLLGHPNSSPSKIRQVIRQATGPFYCEVGLNYGLTGELPWQAEVVALSAIASQLRQSATSGTAVS
jgi:hypothetical protein